MNKPLQKLRRFFARTGTPKKYNATATRDDVSDSIDDDDSGNRLSGAFVVVLLLHIVALVGVFAFARIKESRAALTPPSQPTKPAVSKPGNKQPSASATGATALVANAAQPSQESSAQTQRATTPAATPANARKHIVKTGETLGKISVAYTVPVSELVKSNNLKNETDVHSGQVLTIPDGKFAMKTPAKPSETSPSAPAVPATPAKTVPSTYTVRKNDSVAKIARELGVNYEDMIKLNNIKDPKTIQIGQSLKVPKKN